jgi:hypothetical protein
MVLVDWGDYSFGVGSFCFFLYFLFGGLALVFLAKSVGWQRR